MKDLHSIFEGVCPDCGGQLKLVHVGGLEGWLNKTGIPGNPGIRCPFDLDRDSISVNVWTGWPSRQDNVGCAEFECQRTDCSKKHYVEATPYGDWV